MMAPLSILLLIPLTFGLFPLDKPAKPPTTAREFLSDVGATIIDSPARVEIYRLNVEAKEEPQGEHIEDWEITRTIKSPGSELIARAGEAMLSDKTYDFELFGQDKWCGGFEPGVAVRFWRGETTITGLICFKCNDLAVVVRDEKGRKVHASMADIKPGRAALLTLAKRAFPDDQRIQELKEDPEKE